MQASPATTYFASALRYDDEVLLHQRRLVEDSQFLGKLLDSLPIIVMAVNDARQVVYGNDGVLKFLGLEALELIIGLRPGEVLGCRHAYEEPNGCGTTEYCRTCGAVHSILKGLSGSNDLQECRIIRSDGNAMDLRVWSIPLGVKEEHFTVLTLTDISHEKRRQALERIFFHDVLNTVTGIYGFCTLLKTETRNGGHEYLEIINELTDQLVQEIYAQRDLLAAENSELIVKLTDSNTAHLLKTLAAAFRKQDSAPQVTMLIAPDSEAVTFTTDTVLLTRILRNMIKNAIEAVPELGTVTLAARVIDNASIQFSVHNQGFMPKDIQLQIFQRSFSTKGPGRGLGTYSMKLLTERYLKGSVSFTSSPVYGTTFYVTIPREYPLT